jgi:hypothetical protein
VSYLTKINAQQLEVNENGTFTTPSETSLDVKNSDDNTNSLIRFGDDDVSKSAFGFNGNDDAFKISLGTTLRPDDLTISQTGSIGVNTLPSSHKMFILHNSTSGTSGSEHLSLKENNNGDFARIRFTNLGDDNFFSIEAKAVEGAAKMNFIYNDGSSTNVMTLDGEQFQVGINQTTPEAYLHIAQPNPSIDQIVFENDATGGSDSVDWRVGSDDILIYFNQGLRAAFDAADGSLNNFPLPPPPVNSIDNCTSEEVLEQINKLKPILLQTDQSSAMLSLNPDEVEQINPDWIVYSEDKTRKGVNYQLLTTMALQSVLEQQNDIDQNQEKLNQLKIRRSEMKNILSQLESESEKLISDLGF